MGSCILGAIINTAIDIVGPPNLVWCVLNPLDLGLFTSLANKCPRELPSELVTFINY